MFKHTYGIILSCYSIVTFIDLTRLSFNIRSFVIRVQLDSITIPKSVCSGSVFKHNKRISLGLCNKLPLALAFDITGRKSMALHDSHGVS